VFLEQRAVYFVIIGYNSRYIATGKFFFHNSSPARVETIRSVRTCWRASL
jgi:hypothetical protein